MANKRIKDLSTTAAVTASDDFIAVDGATNGTRKLDAYNPTFGGNLTVSGTGTSTFSGPIRINATSSAPTAGSFSTSAGNGLEIWPKSGSSYDLLVYTAAGSSLLSVPSGTNNLTLAGNFTVSGSIVNQNGVIQSTLAAGALISSLSTNNNAVHGFQISGSGTGSRDWRLEQGRAGDNSFSISNATGGLTTPLIVNGATNNILIGCSSASSDSGNGKLQLATHSTSAGGIGFGTDTSLYRTAAADLSLDGTGGADAVLRFKRSGIESLKLEINVGSSYITAQGTMYLRSANAVALTLDSSQRTILSGALRLANSYVATPQVSTGYVTIQDSTGTTYKVLVAP